MELANPKVWYYLGESTIQRETNRVTLPDLLTESRILDKGGPCHWGCIPEVDEYGSPKASPVFLTSNYDTLRNNRRQFKQQGTVQVQDNNVVTIPKQFFAEYEGQSPLHKKLPEPFRFECGEVLHFAATKRLARERMAYVMPETIAPDILEDLFEIDADATLAPLHERVRARLPNVVHKFMKGAFFDINNVDSEQREYLISEDAFPETEIGAPPRHPPPTDLTEGTLLRGEQKESNEEVDWYTISEREFKHEITLHEE